MSDSARVEHDEDAPHDDTGLLFGDVAPDAMDLALPAPDALELSTEGLERLIAAQHAPMPTPAEARALEMLEEGSYRRLIAMRETTLKRQHELIQLAIQHQQQQLAQQVAVQMETLRRENDIRRRLIAERQQRVELAAEVATDYSLRYRRTQGVVALIGGGVALGGLVIFGILLSFGTAGIEELVALVLFAGVISLSMIFGARLSMGPPPRPALEGVALHADETHGLLDTEEPDETSAAILALASTAER